MGTKIQREEAGQGETRNPGRVGQAGEKETGNCSTRKETRGREEEAAEGNGGVEEESKSLDDEGEESRSEDNE